MSVNARQLGKEDKPDAAMIVTYPDKMLLMLYNGAIKNIENAGRAITDNDFDRAHVQIMIAHDVITKLMFNLSKECRTSGNLVKIYEHLQSKLVDANIKKDIGILHEVRSLMIKLQKCWQQDTGSFTITNLAELPAVENLTRTG